LLRSENNCFQEYKDGGENVGIEKNGGVFEGDQGTEELVLLYVVG